MKRAWIAIGMLVVLAIAPEGYARAVYLNGVDVSSLRSRTFKNVTVTIDKVGNVRIDAPGYDVQVIDAKSDPNGQPKKDKGGPNPSLSKRYYLVTEPSAMYNGAYTFEVEVNGITRWVVKAGAPQVIVEISKWLNKGKNEIVMTAKRDASPPSYSRNQTSLIIGEGHEDNKIVRIDTIEARVTAKASEAGTLYKQIFLDAK